MNLRPLLAPDSVAVVGASATPGKQGNTAIVYLKQQGFAGRIYPINPAGGEIEGLPVFTSIKDVPERVDCVFTVIPPAPTPAAVRECADAGVRAIIVGASGFAEMGSEAGRRRQAEVAEIARTAGIVVLGPNTNGIWNAHHRLALGYNTSHGEPMTPGPISVAAHSGALFDSFIPRLASFGGGFSKLVPLGNEAALDMLDVLEALIEDPETGVIGLVMEGLHDGARFRTLAARSRGAGKPIIVLKLGRSAAGATAALAHSSRLAGSARAYDALMRDCGVPVVRSIETLAAVCTLLSDKRVVELTGDIRLIGASSSGGGCSLMADHAAERGIVLAGAGDGSWTGETEKLISSYAGTGLIRNPIDSGNLHGWDKLPDLIAAMERDGLFGPVVGFAHRLPNIKTDMSLYTPLKARKSRTGAPVVIVSPGGLRPEMEARYAAERIPVFHDLATCFDSLRAVYDAVAYTAEGKKARPGPAMLAPKAAESVQSAIAPRRKGDFLSEIESAAVLRAAGIPMVESRLVASTSEAQQATSAIGFPVVLKAIVTGVAHKNDAGLVAVGITDANALSAAWSRIETNVGKLGAGACQFIVQRQVPSRVEVILGSTFEPALGHFLVAGLGGVHAELLDSVILLPVPIATSTIRDRLADSKLGHLLHKLGKQAAIDYVSQVTASLASLQALILAAPNAIQSVDINPLLIGPEGCLAVDGLIVPRPAA